MMELRERLIHRLRAWAAEYVAGKWIDGAYLFGSLVSDEGIQFEPKVSDIDLLVRFSETCSSPLERLAAMEEIRTKNEELEMDLLRLLERVDATRPITSTTSITSFELAMGVHKSGKPALYSHSSFLDLLADDDHIISFSRKSTVPYEDLQAATAALEGAQAERNQYVAISANSTRLVKIWDGSDPLPKPMARAAAQFRFYRDNLADGSRFSLNRGYDVMSDLLSTRAGEALEYRTLQQWLDIRRAGRGIRKPLEPRAAMLLWEILAVAAEQVLRTRPDQRESARTETPPITTLPLPPPASDGRRLSSLPHEGEQLGGELPSEATAPPSSATEKGKIQEPIGQTDTANALSLAENVAHPMDQLEAPGKALQETRPNIRILFKNGTSTISVNLKGKRITLPRGLIDPKKIKERYSKIKYASESVEPENESVKPQGIKAHLLAAMRKNIVQHKKERRQAIGLYNDCLDKYFTAYESYYEESIAYQFCKKYPINLELIMENIGEIPGRDLEIEIEFPGAPFKVVKLDEFPSLPVPPVPPEAFSASNLSEVIVKYKGYDPKGTSFVEFIKSAVSLLKPAPEDSRLAIDNSPYPRIIFNMEILKHRRPVPFLVLRLVYYRRDFRSFDLKYSIFGSNTRNPMVGSLSVLFD